MKKIGNKILSTAWLSVCQGSQWSISRLQNPAISPQPSSYLTYLGYLSVDYSHSLLLEILSSLGFPDNTPFIFLTFYLHVLCSFSLIFSRPLNVGVSRTQPNVLPFPVYSLLIQFHDFKSQMYMFSLGLSPELQPTWKLHLLVW